MSCRKGFISSRWVFTLHKPLKADWPPYWSGVHYCVFQLEGPNPHYQGYLEFSEPKTFWQVKSLNRRAYWAPAKGTRDQNVQYCTKEATRMDLDLYLNSQGHST